VAGTRWPGGRRVKSEGTLDAARAVHRQARVEAPAPTVTAMCATASARTPPARACHGAKGEGNPALQAPALARRSTGTRDAARELPEGLRGADERDTTARRCARSSARFPTRRPSPMWWLHQHPE
jgi:hypothetical protein